MSESSQNSKVPHRDSIKALVKYLSGNRKVTGIRPEGEQVLYVARQGMSELNFFMTDEYIVGEVDVHDILSDNSDVDVIVAMSAWNSYTSAAKELCRHRGIGIFTFKEFLGAVYYEGNRFLDYISPDERERIRKLKQR